MGEFGFNFDAAFLVSQASNPTPDPNRQYFSMRGGDLMSDQPCNLSHFDLPLISST
jgi:hypothetical protein